MRHKTLNGENVHYVRPTANVRRCLGVEWAGAPPSWRRCLCAEVTLCTSGTCCPNSEPGCRELRPSWRCATRESPLSELHLLSFDRRERCRTVASRRCWPQGRYRGRLCLFAGTESLGPQQRKRHPRPL